MIHINRGMIWSTKEYNKLQHQTQTVISLGHIDGLSGLIHVSVQTNKQTNL